MDDPIKKEKGQYAGIIQKIASESSVGIDAQLTHAIIIDYLQQILKRVDNLEKKVGV